MNRLTKRLLGVITGVSIVLPAAFSAASGAEADTSSQTVASTTGPSVLVGTDYDGPGRDPRPGSAIHAVGTVTDGDGTPVPVVIQTLDSAGVWKQIAAGETDSLGHYDVPFAAGPAGRMALRVLATESLISSTIATVDITSLAAPQATAMILGGHERKPGSRIQVRGSITRQAGDGSTDPVAGAVVAVYRRIGKGPLKPVARVVTRADGKYASPALRVGRKKRAVFLVRAAGVRSNRVTITVRKRSVVPARHEHAAPKQATPDTWRPSTIGYAGSTFWACDRETITFSLGEGASAPQRRLVREGVAAVSKASGYRLVEVAADGDVGFTFHRDLGGSGRGLYVLGRGGQDATDSTGATTRGHVKMRTAPTRGGSDASFRATVIHETAHVLGIGHIEGHQSLMAPVIEPTGPGGGYGMTDLDRWLLAEAGPSGSRCR